MAHLAIFVSAVDITKIICVIMVCGITIYVDAHEDQHCHCCHSVQCDNVCDDHQHTVLVIATVSSFHQTPVGE